MTDTGGFPDGARTALPPGARMRYWRPAGDLAPLVSGYHLYAIGPDGPERQRDVFQPAWPALRFTFGAGNWRVHQPGEPWQPVPPCSVFGPSSRVTWSESGPGITVGIGLRPRGWSRMAQVLASDWADRVGDAAGVFGFDERALREAIAGLTDDEQVPALFDTFLLSHAGAPDGGDAVVGAAEAALLDPELTSVAELARRLGISSRSLERLSRRAFGFSPKLLMRRARFLRSLHAVAQAPTAGRATAIDPGYTDYSHFVRDAQHFLGMSPQAFLKLDTPLLRQSLVLRSQVLGAPAQALTSDRRE
jgi:AraC-like DNA-binding protein